MPKHKRADDEAILKELRDRFEYALNQWKDNRQESDTDMRFLSGQAWDADELTERDDEGRPALNFDELNQFPNQLINDVRQNKRAVKVDPTGSGQTDEEAELRGGMIRDIEYTSSAQAAYVTGFEAAAQRGMGTWAYRTKYTDDASFNLHLEVRRIANQASVVIDPDFKEADASDMEYAFIVDELSREEFKRRFPDAEVIDFSEADIRVVGNQWIDEKRVQVAEYYRVTREKRKLLLYTNPTTNSAKQQGYADALPDGLDYDLLKKSKLIERERDTEKRVVTKFLTNGVEILEETIWPGSWIPLCVVFGKELWVRKGGGYERVLQSLIRLARDPQKLYNYYRTSEAEEAAMTPKVPYIGAKGQFDGNKTDWQNVAKVPKAYLEYNPVTNSTGDQVLPPPQRQPFQPNFQSYEIAADSARRAIMSAVGISPLPTAAQRSNEKSGVALEKISSQAAQGSYHFIDNFDRALEHGGRIMDELLPILYDTKRDVGTRKPDGSFRLRTINDDMDAKSQLKTGRSKVTISTGPSYESQRQEAQDFAELLAKVPGVFPQIADLIVKLKDLGPIGDEIAERLTPPQYRQQDGQSPLSPQAAAIIQQSQQHAQALNAYAQELEKKNKELQGEKDAKVVDNEYKLKIETMRADADLTMKKLQIEAQVTIAEITTKAQEVTVRLKAENDIFRQLHDQAHEAGLQADAQAHEAEQAKQAQDAAAEAASQQQQTQQPPPDQSGGAADQGQGQ
jgi:hypothetical protein